MSKYEAVYFVGDNQAIHRVRVDSYKTRNRSTFSGSLAALDFTFDPSFKVKRGYPIFKMFITHLLLILEVWDGIPTYRKSWAGNLLVWSDLTFDPSFKVK